MIPRFKTFAGLALLALAIAPGPARGQSTSNVIDDASMFSEEAVRKAKVELAKIDRTYGVAVTIETIESLRGLGIEEVAIRKAEQLGHRGIFVLISQRDHKVEALAAPKAFREEVGTTRLNEIRDAFVNEFRDKKINEGLIKGVQAAEKVLAAVRPDAAKGGFLPSSPEGSASGAANSPLVVRQQVRLTLAGARQAIAGAEAKAVKAGWKVNIAAVDDGGHLIAFERMDGARPASVATATTKAVSAATFRQATGPLTGSNADVLLNVSLQNASGGKITTLPGGVPIVVDGQVIGALGVAGGTSEQDAEVAKTGVAAFLEALQARPEEPKKEDPKPKAESEAETKPKAAEEASPKP